MPKRCERRRKTWEEPPELTRIRESFTEQKKRAEYEKIFGCPPNSETELEVWFEFYTTELYNGGYDVP
jgi:hypothetical protein